MSTELKIKDEEWLQMEKEMELMSDQIRHLKTSNAEYEAWIDELECEVFNLKGKNDALNDDLGKSKR